MGRPDGQGPPPRDLAVPQIVWRAGIDLNPLDPAAPDTAAWLETLIWPEHEHRRRRRLACALPLAATAGVRIERGDLRSRLTALVAEVPAQATPVVLHSEGERPCGDNPYYSVNLTLLMMCGHTTS
jgi:hypothetical protein